MTGKHFLKVVGFHAGTYASVYVGEYEKANMLIDDTLDAFSDFSKEYDCDVA